MRIAATLIIAALMAVPLAAQGRGRGRDSGIPPGQLPPAGLCRVWYDGLPPGRQPRPMSCDAAERLARRDRYAQVVYGRDWSRNDRYDPYYRDGRYDRDDRYQESDNWDAARYYRQDNRRYTPRRLGRADRIYRGSDNRYYCRRDDGTSGLIIGGVTGGLLGNIIARGGSKTIGTLLGAGVGAAIGKAVDEGDIVCR